MPCACASQNVYTATRPDGSTMVYSTPSEAAADVLRNGGAYTVAPR